MKKVLAVGRIFHVSDEDNPFDEGTRVLETQFERDGVPWFTYESLTPEDPELNVWEEDDDQA